MEKTNLEYDVIKSDTYSNAVKQLNKVAGKNHPIHCNNGVSMYRPLTLKETMAAVVKLNHSGFKELGIYDTKSIDTSSAIAFRKEDNNIEVKVNPLYDKFFTKKYESNFKISSKEYETFNGEKMNELADENILKLVGIHGHVDGRNMDERKRIWFKFMDTEELKNSNENYFNNNLNEHYENSSLFSKVLDKHSGHHVPDIMAPPWPCSFNNYKNKTNIASVNLDLKDGPRLKLNTGEGIIYGNDGVTLLYLK